MGPRTPVRPADRRQPRARIIRLFTIGYQGASLGGFVAALRDAGVGVLIDVRFHPFSRRPEFRQSALRDALAEAGIGYRHLKALGNPPPSRDAARAGDRAGYERLFRAHLDGAEAQAALGEVLRLAAARAPALMCLERDARDCHRLLVARRLAEMALAAMAPLSVAHLDSTSNDAAQPRLL